MFSCGFDENESSRVVIKNIEPDSLKIILDYVYTGGKDIKMNKDNVQSLLQASNFLQFCNIKKLCVQYLLEHLEITNCLQVLEMAETYDCSEMIISVENFIGRHFAELSKLHAVEGTKNTMIKLLKNEEIQSDEGEVFQALKHWVEKNPKEREKHLVELLEHVRITMISKRTLNSAVIPYLEKFPECQDYLSKAMRYHLLDKEQKNSHVLFNNWLARKGQVKALIGVDTDFCYGYDFDEKKWYKQMQLPQQDALIYFSSQGLFCISNMKYVGSSEFSVWKWNISNAKWLKFSNCSLELDLDNNKTFDFELNGSIIFALILRTDKVLMFDTRQTELGWTWLASLNRIGAYGCIINHGGVLYVFDLNGGYYEYYDRDLKQWTLVQPEKWPSSVDINATLVSHDNLIYATCLDYSTPTMKEFYSFDPTSVTWKRLANYRISPFDHFLLSLGNSLIKITDTHTMEIYDVESNKTWEEFETACGTPFRLVSPCIVNKSLLDKSSECT